MFVVQQGNGFVPDGSMLLQQQQQAANSQGWLQAQPGGTSVILRGAGLAPQAQHTYQQQVQQQQAQQVRMTHVQFNPAQQVLLAGPQNTMKSSGSAAAEGNQVVYVNVNGTLQRGLVQNGAVYLLPNENPGTQMVTSMPQVSTMQQVGGGQALALQRAQQGQQQVMVQQVLSTGQLMPVSGALNARAGVQFPAVQQLQSQAQAQMQARVMPAMSMGFSPQMQQQPVMVMNASMAAGSHVMPAHTAPTGINRQARPQQVVLQLPQAAARAPMVQAAPAAAGTMAKPAMFSAGQAQSFSNSVSTNTASLMPRLGAAGAPAAAQAGRANAASGQPMTIAAALAALPINPAAGSAAVVAANSGEVSSPVAPPGTPGMSKPAGQAAGTISAASSKLAAPQSGAAGANIISAPPSAAQGMSPVTSQPGTPSRSNSVGHHSSSSSSSGSLATDTDVEGKMTVMRMFARTFIETGIGLDQALSMIQVSDREMLATAFAVEAAAALGTNKQHPPSAAAAPSDTTAAVGGAVMTASASAGGLVNLGGEQISMPHGHTSEPAGLLKLANKEGGGASDNTPEAGPGLERFSLGSWGFSLFANAASDMGSNQGGGSFGGMGDAVIASSSTASTTDAATATLFANLHV
jgi:hypothetical protein